MILHNFNITLTDNFYEINNIIKYVLIQIKELWHFAIANIYISLRIQSNIFIKGMFFVYFQKTYFGYKFANIS